jgi:hypothetical protein
MIKKLTIFMFILFITVSSLKAEDYCSFFTSLKSSIIVLPNAMSHFDKFCSLPTEDKKKKTELTMPIKIIQIEKKIIEEPRQGAYAGGLDYYPSTENQKIKNYEGNLDYSFKKERVKTISTKEIKLNSLSKLSKICSSYSKKQTSKLFNPNTNYLKRKLPEEFIEINKKTDAFKNIKENCNF